MSSGSKPELAASILIVDGDIISRHVIADYLRHCSYGVVEAATIEEAFLALGEPTLTIDVILCDVSALGSKSGFELASWVRANRPELEVRLAGGSRMAAETATDLCKEGSHVSQPSGSQAIVEYISQLRASRLSERGTEAGR